MTQQEREKLHAQQIQLIGELRRICEKHGLRWYITAGTLLGAVRHKGFIPWDDDMDIAMPREDYDRLSAVCQKELGEEFFFQDEKSDPGYMYYFSKIRKNGTRVQEPSLKGANMHEGIYIDIFPLDVCPQKDWAGNLYFGLMKVLNIAVLYKTVPGFYYAFNKPLAKIPVTAARVLSHRALSRCRDKLRKLVDKLCRGDRLCTVCGAHGYPRETYDKSWFAESVLLEFEGDRYPAPAEWDALLTNMYGDYMTPPPIEEQTGHFE